LNWSKIILECLNDPNINRNRKDDAQSFSFLTHHDLVGLATFIFSTRKVSQKVQNYEWLDIKTGFKGNLGHKGALMLFIQIDSSWFTLINCHLASGEGKKSERFQDIEFIHN
jgi:hypothetical protein